MRKHRYIDSVAKRLIAIIIVSAVILLTVIFLVKANIMPHTSFGWSLLVALVTISFLALFVALPTFFAYLYEEYKAEKSYLRSCEQIKALPSDFVNVRFKYFDKFPLSDFVSSEDITCFAKLDEDGNVVYAIQLNVEYETNDYELFLNHFEF